MPELKVTLLIPGYAIEGVQDSTGPATESLDQGSATMLKWLDGQLHMPWQAQLCRLLGLVNEKGDTLPQAGFARLEPDREIVCAAPIHLKADRDTASLIPPQQLELTHTEADELVASLNDFLSQDGIELSRNTLSDWFMIGLDGQDLKSFPPTYLAHRNASTFLPDGQNSAHWRRLLTEIQMLLHSHPVNVLRESSGKLPVNSLWFWGGAALPELSEASGLDSLKESLHIYTEDAYAQALGAYMGISHEPLNRFDVVLAEYNDVHTSLTSKVASDVVVIDTCVIDAWLCGDDSGVSEARKLVDTRWIRPLIGQVKQGSCLEFEILTEDGQHAVCDIGILDDHARQVAAAQPSWWKRMLTRFR